MSIQPTDEAKAEVLAISKSSSGHNSFYFECKACNRHTSYSCCQHIIKAIREKRAGVTNFQDCRNSLLEQTCPAFKMIIAERKAGRALFFKPYTISSAVSDELSGVKRYSSSPSTAKTTALPVKKAKTEIKPNVEVDSSNIYAQAAEKAAKESSDDK